MPESQRTCNRTDTKKTLHIGIYAKSQRNRQSFEIVQDLEVGGAVSYTHLRAHET